MRDIRTITLHGTFVQVEFDYWRPKRCDKCGKKIWLARKSDGRYIPIEEQEEPDSEDTKFVVHFPLCQKAREATKVNH